MLPVDRLQELETGRLHCLAGCNIVHVALAPEGAGQDSSPSALFRSPRRRSSSDRGRAGSAGSSCHREDLEGLMAGGGNSTRHKTRLDQLAELRSSNGGG